jgi:hypothetical protein
MKRLFSRYTTDKYFRSLVSECKREFGNVRRLDKGKMNEKTI